MPAEITWTRPEGGFFTWVTLAEGLESAALQPLATAEGVAYVPGEQFCCDGGGKRSLRLAFSMLAPDDLREGARRLGRAIRRGMARTQGAEGDG